MITIDIANEFSKTPGSRRIEDGPYSGEEFYQNILKPRFQKALSENSNLTVFLDGTLGYATSFLEAAFGGLAREFGIPVVLDHLQIETKRSLLKKEIEGYIYEAND